MTTAMSNTLAGQIALMLFFLAFLAIVAYALLKPKKDVDEAAHLPLEEDEDDKPDHNPEGS